MSDSTDYDVEIAYLESFIYGTNPGATPPQATSFTIQQTNPAVKWIFKQVAVENNNAASGNTTVTLYLNNVLLAPSSFMTPTPRGIGTAAAGLPYAVLSSTDTLMVAVTGATTGDQITVQGLYTQVTTTT